MRNRIRLIFVRHGETDDNARSVIQGHIDTPLNENGIIQSGIVRDHLKDTPIDVCYTSDLRRASKTAEIIMEHHQDSPILVDNRIKEKSLGLLEGTVYYAPSTPEALASIEPSHIFTSRLLSFFDVLFPSLPRSQSSNGHSPQTSILPESVLSKPESTVLIVSHGGPIKIILPALVKERGLEWAPGVRERADRLKRKVWNCSLSEVTMERNGEDSAWQGAITEFVSVTHFERAGEALKEGTEADAAMTMSEQSKEWWKP